MTSAFWHWLDEVINFVWWGKCPPTFLSSRYNRQTAHRVRFWQTFLGWLGQVNFPFRKPHYTCLFSEAWPTVPAFLQCCAYCCLRFLASLNFVPTSTMQQSYPGFCCLPWPAVSDMALVSYFTYRSDMALCYPAISCYILAFIFCLTSNFSLVIDTTLCGPTAIVTEAVSVRLGTLRIGLSLSLCQHDIGYVRC